MISPLFPMMPGSLILLTECGAEIGLGHVSRCTALMEAFRAAGCAVELWVEADASTRAHLPAGAHEVGWRDASEEVVARLRAAAGVLVDSLRVTPEQLERIAALNKRFAVIDDWFRFPHRRGIVIDWTIGAERFAYGDRFPGVHYLLGSRFCALRPDFCAASSREIPAEPRSILVTFGGADVRRLTGPVVSELQREFPNLELQVVVGAGVLDRGFVGELDDERTTVHFACNTAKMRDLMARADLAICAGGQTLYELASLGLPPVVAQVVDNQTDDVREFAACGFALVAGDWRTEDLPGRIATGVRALWPASERRRRAAAGRAAVDGQGAVRLVAACLAHWQAASAVV